MKPCHYRAQKIAVFHAVDMLAQCRANDDTHDDLDGVAQQKRDNTGHESGAGIHMCLKSQPAGT